MKRVLFLDRGYLFRHIKGEDFECIYAALTPSGKKYLQKLNQKVVGCFEEEYDLLEVASYDDNYLNYSYDSDRFLNHYDFEKRREILGKEISFWRNILDTYQPTCIFGEVVTIEWMEVLYNEAKLRHIPYNSFLYGFKNGYCYWLDKPFNSEISEERWNTVEVKEEHIEEASKYYYNVQQNQEKPFYIQNLKHSNIRCLLAGFRYWVKECFSIYSRKGFVYEEYTNAAKLMMERGFRGYTRKHDSIANIDNSKHSYIFYPLHYEPEATISYFADAYCNQASDICHIAHALNSNQVLIVKEHPQQLNMLLCSRFYNLKKKYSNIVFLRGDVSSYEVFKKIDAVVTLTGTGGLEAMICGIPVITLGKVFYNFCESTTLCPDFNVLKMLLREKKYKVPQKKQVIEFIEKFFALQVKGYAVKKYIGQYDENYQALYEYIKNTVNTLPYADN